MMCIFINGKSLLLNNNCVYGSGFSTSYLNNKMACSQTGILLWTDYIIPRFLQPFWKQDSIPKGFYKRIENKHTLPLYTCNVSTNVLQ